MTEQPTITRRTSIYTIRLQSADAVTAAAAGLRAEGIPIADHGDLTVSYRASSDEDALRVLRRVTRAPQRLSRAAVLTTGLGVHRRTVEG